MQAMVPDLIASSGLLNEDKKLDFTYNYSLFLENSIDNFNFIENPLLSNKLSSNYYNESSFIDCFRTFQSPLVLNLNIQYLLSKFEKFTSLLSILSDKGIIFEIISLQEISCINDASLVNIPGYHPFVFKSRTSCKGGGIGFYIRNNLKFKVFHDFSPFHERIIVLKLIFLLAN